MVSLICILGFVDTYIFFSVENFENLIQGNFPNTYMISM